jgi:hypothetical protein
MISVEYCHIADAKNIEQELKKTKKMKWFFDVLNSSNKNIEYFIMVDDLHGITFDEDLRKIFKKLKPKPDLIIPESSFVQIAEKILKILEGDSISHIVTYSEEKFLKDIQKKYKSTSEFQLSYLKNHKVTFSFPVFIAASYVWRLGLFDDVVDGRKSPKASKLIQVLPNSFIDVESTARIILKRCGFKNLPIEYYFYD